MDNGLVFLAGIDHVASSRTSPVSGFNLEQGQPGRPPGRGAAMTGRESRVDLNLFRILDAIHTHGGIGAAARALHLTQPAVSHALNRLRAHFDDPLFVRQGNRVFPTERTRAVIADVQAHLKGLQAVSRLRADFDPAALEMEFALGFRDALEPIVLPRLLARLAASAPGLRLVSRRVALGELERELVAGRIDLAVDRRLPVGPRLVTEYLIEDSLVVAMRRRHALAAGTMRRAEYLAARHVAVSPLGEPHTLDVLLGQSGVFRDIRLVCQHYFAACEAIAGSDLLLTLPLSYAQHLSERVPILVRPLPLRVRPFPILGYWHESRQHDQAHAWLRGQVGEIIRGEPGMRRTSRRTPARPA
ncbi:LysR family transcriptional regulator [Luteimonas aquatica]|uniref:LysR family transcriptional regulator n=1 Tax=Luteimonas aquatica TaxID=450364 RepID=UPI001F55B07C|nr:LysR family transcriptional regulator [Luteimonas aquatica]